MLTPLLSRPEHNAFYQPYTTQSDRIGSVQASNTPRDNKSFDQKIDQIDRELRVLCSGPLLQEKAAQRILLFLSLGASGLVDALIAENDFPLCTASFIQGDSETYLQMVHRIKQFDTKEPDRIIQNGLPVKGFIERVEKIEWEKARKIPFNVMNFYFDWVRGVYQETSAGEKRSDQQQLHLFGGLLAQPEGNALFSLIVNRLKRASVPSFGSPIPTEQLRMIEAVVNILLNPINFDRYLCAVFRNSVGEFLSVGYPICMQSHLKEKLDSVHKLYKMMEAERYAEKKNPLYGKRLPLSLTRKSSVLIQNPSEIRKSQTVEKVNREVSKQKQETFFQKTSSFTLKKRKGSKVGGKSFLIEDVLRLRARLPENGHFHEYGCYSQLIRGHQKKIATLVSTFSWIIEEGYLKINFNDLLTQSERINALTRTINQFSNFVELSVLECQTADEAKESAKIWVETVRDLKDKGNFETAFAIFSGLNKHPVGRLHDFFYKHVDGFSELMNPEVSELNLQLNRYKGEMWQRLERSPSNTLPPIFHFLSSITAGVEGNALCLPGGITYNPHYLDHVGKMLILFKRMVTEWMYQYANNEAEDNESFEPDFQAAIASCPPRDENTFDVGSSAYSSLHLRMSLQDYTDMLSEKIRPKGTNDYWKEPVTPRTIVSTTS